ncbi:hypothetical protein RFF05_03520 [Bengtsoniella intestinalis]
MEEKTPSSPSVWALRIKTSYKSCVKYLGLPPVNLCVNYSMAQQYGKSRLPSYENSLWR